MAEQKIVTSLMNSLSTTKGPLTLADASTKSGLSLHETKLGLNFLISEYRGALSVTSEGELLYSFPTGFTKPWHQQEMLEKWLKKAKKGFLGVLKFVVRAWICIVMVAYVAIFALILIALTFSKSNDREESSFGGTLMLHALMRLVLDSLFWTFHPFSPFNVMQDDFYDRGRIREKKMPFYERVNRFFFGPEEQVFDREEATRRILQEIRAQKGRIGLLDVMRVTGFSKEEADPFMAKLMLDYEGDVLVSEQGGIYYEFVAMRKSAEREFHQAVPPIWHKRELMPEFTGNPAGSNMLIVLLNGFNLLMSSVAIANSWTVEKLQYFFAIASSKVPIENLPSPPEGVPLVLGWIPLIFSATLFLIPIGRALTRPKKKREIDNKNGKRGLLRVILSKINPRGIKEDVLKQGWTEQAKAPVDEKEFMREIIRLGGDIEMNEATPTYRFHALEAELKALENAREKASNKEASIGEVIFNSQK